MALKSYETLLQQVQTLIDEVVPGGVSITSKNVITDLSRVQASDYGYIIKGIVDDLGSVIESRIISGLYTTATTPASNEVLVTAGIGTAAGKKYELENDTTLEINFDDRTSIYYIVLYGNQVLVTSNVADDQCKIAKIVVPNPGVTSQIVDDKPSDGYDAWIVSARDVVFDEDQEFDDDSIEKLRDVIGDVLADNLIGNIRLSENLKIINTQGSFELDSASVKIKDINANVLAKFDRKGTFFYDTDGRTLAKFSIDEAYVGNILIKKNAIQTRNFSSGALGSGFQILDNGNAEFNNILARGKITCSIFEKETISAIGGNLLVMDCDILNLDMTALDNSTLTIKGDTTFAVNDILRIKDGINDEWLEITNISNAPTYSVTRDKANSYIINTNPIWKKGTAVVNYKSSGHGGIFMTSSESNAPFLSVLTHAGSPWSITTTQLRLGNLNGFLGYAIDLYGIAIGETEKYLKYDSTNGLQIKGSIIVTGGDAFSKTLDNLDDISDGTTYKLIPATSVTGGQIIVAGLAAAVTGMMFTNSTTKTNIEAWRHASDVTLIDGGDIYAASVTATKLSVAGINSVDGKLILSQISSGTLDNIPDGTTYKLMPATSVTGGQIIVAGLAAAVTGMMFADSTTKTNIEAWRHASDVTLIDGGDIYAASVTATKLSVAGINSADGKLILSQISSGTLDNIPDGTTYKLMPATSVTGGQIIVAGLAAAVTGMMFTNSTTKTNIEAWRHASDVTLIDGGDIYASSITATKINVSQLDALTVNTGSLTVDEYIQSANYSAGTTGFKLDYSTGLEINTGTIKTNFLYCRETYPSSLWFSDDHFSNITGSVTVSYSEQSVTTRANTTQLRATFRAYVGTGGSYTVTFYAGAVSDSISVTNTSPYQFYEIVLNVSTSTLYACKLYVTQTAGTIIIAEPAYFMNDKYFNKG